MRAAVDAHGPGRVGAGTLGESAWRARYSELQGAGGVGTLIGPADVRAVLVDPLVQWSASLRARYAFCRPAAKDTVDQGVPRGSKFLRVAERELIDIGKLEDVPQVDAGAFPFRAQVVRILDCGLGLG